MDQQSGRSSTKRRAVSMQSTNSSRPDIPTTVSPKPSLSKFAHGLDITDDSRPVSRRQYVSVDWQEQPETHSSRLQIGLEECVETKTVTTTTTTKRSYPALQIQRPSLSNLDAKEYPLAARELPLELQRFSYALEVGGHDHGPFRNPRRTVKQSA